jgi:dTDP-4-amino-4,6-dideoxygalactose transaminase
MRPVQVPFLDLAAAHRELAAEIEPAVLEVLRSGHYILGPEVESFEADYAASVGTRHCIGVGNGLDALRLVLEGWGIGRGDEVVVPVHTYIATWFAVSATGARPVPVDVDEATYLVSPEAVEAALTPRTRAIIGVHLYGRPAPLDRITPLASGMGIKVLEDAAQAQGARLHGTPVGRLGDAAAWSFYPVKNLGAAGDAGAVTTDDDELARRVRLARNQGAIVRSVHEIVGANSRLDPIQAVILRAKLARLEAWNGRRRAIAARYMSELAGTPIRLPSVAWGEEPVWHQFVIRHPNRDSLRVALAEAGIETLIHYETPPHLQPAYRHMGLGPGSFPVSEALAREILSLPIDPMLSDAAVGTVIEAVKGWATGVAARR